MNSFGGYTITHQSNLTAKYIAPFLVLVVIGLDLGCGGENSSATDKPTTDPKKVQSKDLSSNDEQVQADVRALVKATHEKDVPSVLKYTHPKIIAALGGRNQAETTLQTVYAKIGPMSLESFTFPESPTYVETDRNDYVVVPTLSVISQKGQRSESLNFQFGVREKGSMDWKYIEGSRINQQNVRSLFPDFPADFEFPEFYRKKI